jgi:phage terminase Nu1 subunit (DNA packaging protein)
MSPDAYCKRFTSLNLTQEQAGELFGASARTGQRWAAGGPPLGNDRAKLVRARRNRRRDSRYAIRSRRRRLS